MNQHPADSTPAAMTPAAMTKVQRVASADCRDDCELHLVEDLMGYFQEYTRRKPEVVAMWGFGIGFVLGWKLKPW